jgi:hypothetical protein
LTHASLSGGLEAGAWIAGHMLFTAARNTNTATVDLPLYDAMKAAYASLP